MNAHRYEVSAKCFQDPVLESKIGLVLILHRILLAKLGGSYHDSVESAYVSNLLGKDPSMQMKCATILWK